MFEAGYYWLKLVKDAEIFSKFFISVNLGNVLSGALQTKCTCYILILKYALSLST